MTHQETPSGRPLDREKTLFRYTRALERSDFETVAAALHEAEGDPVLAQMIAEVNEVMAAETGAQTMWEPAVTRPRRSWTLRMALILTAVLLICGFFGLFNLRFMAPPPLEDVAGFRNIDPVEATAAALHEQLNNAQTQVSGGGADVDAEATISELQARVFPETTGEPPEAIQVTPVGGGTPGLLALPTLPSASEQPAEPQEPMIVKNGEIEVVVEDTGVAIERIEQIAADGGGYVLSSQAWSSGEDHSAAVVIAVQVDQFETAMRRIRDLALEVVFESSSGQDVSTEYVDLQSRLRNLEATRDRILTFLERAETVEEALAINAELSEIEAQIEQVQGRMQYLAGRAAYSTITISIEEFINATPTPTPTPTGTPAPWSLEPRIEQATRQQTALVRGLLEVLTWFLIVPGPYVLGLGLIALVVRAVIQRGSRGGSPPTSGRAP